MVEDYYYETPFNNTSEAKIKHRLVAEWKPASKKEAVKNFLDNSYPKTFQNLEHSIRIEVDGEDKESSIFNNTQTFIDAMTILGARQTKLVPKNVIVFNLGSLPIYFNILKDETYMEYDEDPEHHTISDLLEKIFPHGYYNKDIEE